MFNDPLAFDYTKCPHNALTGKIIGAAIEVHRTLGPGLLESAYEACLVFELQEKGLNIERQKPLPLVYKNVKLDSGYRLDLIVETKVVVEVKSMTEIAAVHKAQRYCCVNRFLTPRSPSFHEITESYLIKFPFSFGHSQICHLIHRQGFCVYFCF